MQCERGGVTAVLGRPSAVLREVGSLQWWGRPSAVLREVGSLQCWGRPSAVLREVGSLQCWGRLNAVWERWGHCSPGEGGVQCWERWGSLQSLGLSAPSLPTPTCGHQPSCCSVIPFSIVAILLQCDSALWLCCCSVISFSIVAILLQCVSIQRLLLWPQPFLYSGYQCRPLLSPLHPPYFILLLPFPSWHCCLVSDWLQIVWVFTFVHSWQVKLKICLLKIALLKAAHFISTALGFFNRDPAIFHRWCLWISEMHSCVLNEVFFFFKSPNAK